MTSEAELLALADRCERAAAGDADIDHAIGAAMNASGWHAADCIANFTRSLDAAMTLVPEGWAIDWISMWPASPEGVSNQSDPQASVEMVGTSVERMGRKMVWGHGGKDGRARSSASTPALALCAAALRARAATIASSGER